MNEIIWKNDLYNKNVRNLLGNEGKFLTNNEIESIRQIIAKGQRRDFESMKKSFEILIQKEPNNDYHRKSFVKIFNSMQNDSVDEALTNEAKSSLQKSIDMCSERALKQLVEQYLGNIDGDIDWNNLYVEGDAQGTNVLKTLLWQKITEKQTASTTKQIKSLLWDQTSDRIP